MLKIICINDKHSIKLIKGAVYLANALYTSTNTYKKTIERVVYIEKLGRFNIKYFTDINGEPLDKLSDFNNWNNVNNLALDTSKKDYTGQFVKCTSNTGKTLKEGEIYYVELQKKTRYSTVFKIRGIKNNILPYHFEEIPIKEQRSIKLKNLKGETTKTGERTRKYLLFSEKEKISIMFSILSQVLIDINNTSEIDVNLINITELMTIKGKRNYNIIEEDIQEFTNKFLKNNIESLIKSHL